MYEKLLINMPNGQSASQPAGRPAGQPAGRSVSRLAGCAIYRRRGAIYCKIATCKSLLELLRKAAKMYEKV